MKHNESYRIVPQFPRCQIPEDAHGDRIPCLKQYQDDTRYMAIFEVLEPFDGHPYPGEFFLRFLTEAEYDALKQLQKDGCIQIAYEFHVIEGNTIPVGKKRKSIHHRKENHNEQTVRSERGFGGSIPVRRRR